MTENSSPGPANSTSWEYEIRIREEEARVAFLKADLDALDTLWAENFAVNSPLQQVMQRKPLMELLRAGKIRHSASESEIEHMSRHGDVVVVMGRDRVVDPPDNAVSLRRFTNVWQLDKGVWRMIARHAQVVSRMVP